MNQDQRKFLIARVEQTFKKQVKEIETLRKIQRPSLNNYLVAAFLDNSIQFNDIDLLKTKMRSMVLKFGVGDKLVRESREKYYSNDEKAFRNKDTCEIIAEDLFIIPQAYLDALADYEAQESEIKSKIEQLEAQKDTILLKIQIGSNQVLDKLVTQVDNLADLNIMNTQFLLT